MKFLVVLACALAVASASGIVAPLATVYAGSQHLPIIDHEGVPVDTADVQHAKAAHYAHKVNAHARNGDYAVAPVVAATYAAPAVAAHTYAAAPVVASTYAAAPVVSASYAAPAVAAHTYAAAPVVAAGYAAHGFGYAAHAYAAPIAYAHGPAAYPTTAVLPSSVNGVPLETPEVVAAKSHHFAAHAEALTRSGHLYRHRRGIVAAPLAYSAAYTAPVVASAYAAPFYGGYAHAPAVATYAAHPYAYSHYY